MDRSSLTLSLWKGELGVKFTQAPTKEPWGTFAILVDPDGNEFVLTEGG